MKRTFGKTFWIETLLTLFAVTLLLFYPTSTYAVSQELTQVDIHSNVEALTVGDLSFSNIMFVDDSATSTQAFGLTGKVENHSDKTITYTATVRYYDVTYTMIAQGYASGMVAAGTSDFNQMSNLSLLDGHAVEEIAYYDIVIEIPGDASSAGFIDESLKTPSMNPEYSSRDYVIDNYDVNIVVRKNNSLLITETITAFFFEDRHGIVRTLPLENTITRLDGTVSENQAKISNLKVDNAHTVSKVYKDYEIQIGSAFRTVRGKQTYTISYIYNLGKDPMEEYDELYYNIIGADWDTYIGNVTFTITMPKEFDSSKLGFSSGREGTTDNRNVRYSVSGNTITGSYEGILAPREALTVRCELEEGYFVNRMILADFLPTNNTEYLNFSMPIIFLLISAWIWYQFGHNEKIVETVEFYPPEGINSLEAGFLYKGEADSQDVTSLLIYLANKGYLKISNDKDHMITKLREYDGNDENERMFLEGLFGTDEYSGKPLRSLRCNFYATMRKILKNMNQKENKNKIIQKTFLNLNPVTLIKVLMIIISCVGLFNVYKNINIMISGYVGLAWLLMAPLAASCFYEWSRKHLAKKKLIKNLVAVQLVYLFLLLPLFMLVFHAKDMMVAYVRFSNIRLDVFSSCLGMSFWNVEVFKILCAKEDTIWQGNAREIKRI